MHNNLLLWIYLMVGMILPNLPFVGKYFAISNTLIHEVSHAIVAIITSGKVHKISLKHDASGSAVTSSQNRFARILVSYAGYTGASLSAYGLYYLLYKEHYTFIFYFFLTLLVVSTVLWVRNLFGFIWSISFISLFVLVIRFKLTFLIIHVSFFLSSVVLVQSVVTAFIILKLSIKNRKNAGDTTNLATATFIPAIFWGTLFFVQSILAAYYIFKEFVF